MAAGQLAGVMEGPLAADGGLCWGEGQGLGCEGWESGASPPSVATYKGLILAQEGELHFLGLVQRICVAQGGPLLSLCPSSLPSGQLMTHLGSDFPPGAGVLDVMYESPSTLLSCGYDTYVRYWDLRVSVR